MPYLSLRNWHFSEFCGLPILQDEQATIDLADRQPTLADFYGEDSNHENVMFLSFNQFNEKY